MFKTKHKHYSLRIATCLRKLNTKIFNIHCNRTTPHEKYIKYFARIL